MHQLSLLLFLLLEHFLSLVRFKLLPREYEIWFSRVEVILLGLFALVEPIKECHDGTLIPGAHLVSVRIPPVSLPGCLLDPSKLRPRLHSRPSIAQEVSF